ncbi:hypothetical protein [Nocardioides sp. CFH 31398]|uniref:hypothetical protein n=1 Tax=Nocardioides sp. CFH 31398 TaxID=2919579 RepID=UPI001F06F27A|nr:hypothetical protein [Nocardioides sp. CFH 31398]MCH1865388.1 hypothetical protein [Nocardioides sp. CFH 31398]
MLAAPLVGGVVALGLLTAPVQADPADPPSAVERWVASAAAGAPEDDETVGSPVRSWSKGDPRGDAERGTSVVLRGPRTYLDLADLTAVSYRTPARRGGDLVLRSRWASLGDARGPGVRRQAFLTLLSGPGERFWTVFATNHDDRVVVREYVDGEPSRVRPEEVSVRRQFGRGGTMTVTVSSEWLTAPRVYAVSAAFSRRAVDRSPYSPLLDVGPVR